MEAEHPGAWVLRLEALAHDARPEAARGAKLGDLLEQVVVRVQKEREARRDVVHGEPAGSRGFHIGDAVRQREGHLLNGGRARLADVIAADGNRVPFRGALVAIGEDICNQAQRRLRGVNVRAARDVFLKDVCRNSTLSILEDIFIGTKG